MRADLLPNRVAPVADEEGVTGRVKRERRRPADWRVVRHGRQQPVRAPIPHLPPIARYQAPHVR